MNKDTEAIDFIVFFLLWQIYVNESFSLPFWREQLSVMQ